MAISAQYASTVKTAVAQISTANTARDGTGTLVTLFTAGASGSRVDDLTISATGTTTAGMLRLFVHDGTSAFLLRELPVSAVTPSATVAAFTTSLYGLSLVLATGYSLRASTHNAETFVACVTRAGDF